MENQLSLIDTAISDSEYTTRDWDLKWSEFQFKNSFIFLIKRKVKNQFNPVYDVCFNRSDYIPEINSCSFPSLRYLGSFQYLLGDAEIDITFIQKNISLTDLEIFVSFLRKLEKELQHKSINEKKNFLLEYSFQEKAYSKIYQECSLEKTPWIIPVNGKQTFDLNPYFFLKYQNGKPVFHLFNEIKDELYY